MQNKVYAQNGLGIHYEDVNASLTVDIKHIPHTLKAKE